MRSSPSFTAHSRAARWTATVSVSSLALLASVAGARVISDSADAAIADAVVRDFDGIADLTPSTAAFTVGDVLVTAESPGSDSGSIISCQGTNVDCQLVVYDDGPVTLTFSPPVGAVALNMEYSVGGFAMTAVGSDGEETFTDADVGWEHPNTAFAGATDIGLISSLTITSSDYATFFDEIHIREELPIGGSADGVLTTPTPELSAGAGGSAALRFDALDQGPAAAPNAEIAALLWPGTVVESGTSGYVDHGTSATLPLGTLPSGGTASFDLTLGLPERERFSCDDIATTIAVLRHDGSDPDLGNNIAVASTRFDRSTAAATESCDGDGIDDDCDGLIDCADPDCSDTPSCPVALTDLSRNPFPPFIPVIPADGSDPFENLPDPRETPAGNQRCENTNIHGELIERPAICCATRPCETCTNPSLAQWRQACPPLDPNHKEAEPAVNALGYGKTHAGQRIEYALSYENIGGSDAHDVQIIDVLDLDLDARTIEIEDGGTYDPDTRTLVWVDPVVPPHTPRTVHFSARVLDDAPDGTRVKNVATIVFPDADPPTRIDTNPVEHVIPLPSTDTSVAVSILRCDPTDEPDTYLVQLVSSGFGFAYDLEATITDAPSDFEIVDGECRFAHPTDEDPEALSVVVPRAYTTSVDPIIVRVPEDVDDPCEALTWEITYFDADGRSHGATAVGTDPGGDTDGTDPDSGSGSGGSGAASGDSGCGCSQSEAPGGGASVLFLLAALGLRRRRVGRA